MHPCLGYIYFTLVCAHPTQVMAFVSLASSLSSEKQNKLAQLLFKTHMSYLDSNANESERKLIKQQFQKCFEEVNIQYIQCT